MCLPCSLLLLQLPVLFLVARRFLASRLLSSLPVAGVPRGCIPPPSTRMVARTHAEYGDVSVLYRNQMLARMVRARQSTNINRETRREATNSRPRNQCHTSTCQPSRRTRQFVIIPGTRQQRLGESQLNPPPHVLSSDPGTGSHRPNP